MQRWIAFLRGVNVGGRNPLRMPALVAEIERLKCKNVRTYIQSGNVVFDSNSKSAATLADKIARQIEDAHGFRPNVLVLDPASLQTAIANNPFPNAITVPQSLHFYFLDAKPSSPNLDALRDAQSASEDWLLRDRVFYLHAPDGVARSQLAANAEKHLGVAATARNYRTVEKVMEYL